MASGCIMGTCPECGDLVWEDDWIMYDDKIMHPDCRRSYIRRRSGMSEEQFERLTRAQSLREEIQETRQIIAESVKFWNERLAALEKELAKVKKGE